MTAKVVRVMPIRKFDFSNLAAGEMEFVVVAERIDVAAWRRATIAARLHASDIGTGAKISVVAMADGWTPDDPAANFIDGDNHLGLVEFTQTDKPKYRTVGVDAERMGAMIAIMIVAEQATTTPVSMQATLSADVVLND